MRKVIFILISFIATVGVVFFFVFASRINTPMPVPENLITPFPTITGIQIPQGDRLEISNIEVNNFYTDASRIDDQKNVYIIDDRALYQIVYEEKFNQFLVSILGSPFEELRIEAEQKLIAGLGVSEIDACFLNVLISTPAFANPDFSGKSYRLSFCE